MLLLLLLRGLHLGCRRLHNLRLHYRHGRGGRLSLCLRHSGRRAVAAAAGLREGREGKDGTGGCLCIGCTVVLASGRCWGAAAGATAGTSQSSRCLRAAQRHIAEVGSTCQASALQTLCTPHSTRGTELPAPPWLQPPLLSKPGTLLPAPAGAAPLPQQHPQQTPVHRRAANQAACAGVLVWCITPQCKRTAADATRNVAQRHSNRDASQTSCANEGK